MMGEIPTVMSVIGYVIIIGIAFIRWEMDSGK